MKILLISFDFPYPPAGGTISRDYNLFKQLAGYNDLYWINRTINSMPNEEYIEHMRPYFKEMHIVPWDYRQDPIGFVKSFFTGEPYIIYRHKSKEMEQKVRKVLNNNFFDLVLCDHIYLEQYLPRGLSGQMPVIPNNEDNGFTYFYRMAQSGSFLRRLYGKMQWKKMLGYELKVLSRYKAYLTTSEEEKNLMRRYNQQIDIKVIPNGVDTDYFRPAGPLMNSLNIVFTGWFKYYPNVDAVKNFVENIFPLVKQKLPDAVFTAAGKDPDKILKYHNGKDIIVTGFVKDIREYLKNAAASVVPLNIGGGTRLKILEAMAMGIPVVSTVLGAEGLKVQDGETILLAENNSEFAEKLVTLLTDNKLAEKLSCNGVEFVRKHHSWDTIGASLNNYLNTFVKEYDNKLSND